MSKRTRGDELGAQTAHGSRDGGVDLQIAYDALQREAAKWVRLGIVSADLAEDFVQEASLRILERPPRYITSGYAAKMLQFVRASFYKRRAAKKRGAGAAHAELAAAAQVADVSPDPEACLLTKEWEARFGAMVRALPTRQRTVIQLLNQGLTSEDVAQHMGTTGSAVRALLRRALLSLKHQWVSRGQDDGFKEDSRGGAE